MKRIISFIFGSFVAMAVLSSCGEKHEAKATVEQFLTENLLEAEPRDVKIERLDSTNFLVDSVIVKLQDDAQHSPIYKKGVTFAARPEKQGLVWVLVSYANNGKQFRQTFYLTRDCQKVVAVKP